MANPHNTGQNAIAKIGGEEFEFSNISWDYDTGTADVQYNSSLFASRAVTDIRVSGSFEWDGADEDIRPHFFWGSRVNPLSQAEGAVEAGQPRRFTMTVKETNVSESGIAYRTWTFENVIVTSVSRDNPSDDVASSSFDWECEDVDVAISTA